MVGRPEVDDAVTRWIKARIKAADAEGASAASEVMEKMLAEYVFCAREGYTLPDSELGAGQLLRLVSRA